MKESKFIVLITKKWAKHAIEIKLTEEDINISMDLDDYFEQLLGEFGSPTMVLTKKQFAEKIKLARLAVEAAMKDTTKYVV